MDIKIKEETRKIVLQFLHNGNKIEAIKMVREECGCGLKEAKDYVESMVDDHNTGLPENQHIKKSGCVVFILIGIGFMTMIMKSI